MNDERQRARDLRARVTGRGVYPVEYAHWLLSPFRNLTLPAGRVVRRLQLKPTDHVLEIGSGPGYFSPAVARAVHRGKLTLFDLQPEMLELARKRLLARQLSNFECFSGSAVSLPFSEASFDAAFMVTVLGEVGEAQDRQHAVVEAARVLKPGGLLSITEMFGDPDYVRIAELERYADVAKLALERRYGPRFLYTCNLRKTG
jgi:ubiquinone/menaquinone biosynthesis C-methylase UbiE